METCTYSTSVKEAIQRELKAARDIADQATKEDRNLTGDEQAKVQGAFENVKALRVRAENQADLSRQLSELSDGIGFDSQPGEKAQPDHYGRPVKGMSLGQAFTNSAQYKSLMDTAPGGRFIDQMRIQSQPFGVKSLLTKQGGGGGGPGLITGESDGSAGAFVTPVQYGTLDAFYARPLTLRQLVTTGRIGTDTVEYVRVSNLHNAAAPVPEATTHVPIDGTIVTEAAGGLKPQSSMAFEKITAPVKTIAHWLPATKRSLSDAAQVRTYIDSFMTYGLEEALEDQMLTGDGTGENFEGLASVSGVQTQGAPGAGETILDVLRKARTKVEVGGRTAPTAYVLHPTDAEAVDLLKDGQERYLGAGPFGQGPLGQTIWGLPRVTSEAVEPGTAWCGDWSKAVLWDREQATITISDSHADFFTRNLVAILGEQRSAFGVLRAAAFVEITLA